ncbi:MAG TPA: hypothetical protein VFY71_10960 [Planctomycetota bacterium]|nr:hypothetical protein [Planctomycetota bacterium]
MKTHITFALGLATLLLGAGATHAQDPGDVAARRRAAAAEADQQRAPDVTDVSPDDLPAVQRVIEDEAAHRDRLARIHRLRELAQADGDRQRLARLDDLEREEQQVYQARRLRARERLSEQDWNTAEDLVRRGGRMRVRMADNQAARERAAAHKSARERAAEADKSRNAQRSSSRSPSRAPSRSGSNSSSNSSGGGRSPR